MKNIPNSDLGPRDLSNQLNIASGVTVESCTAACKSGGYGLAGLEYGKECCKFIPPQPSRVSLSPNSLD